MKTDWYKIAKVVIAVIALFLFYLYILNNRYSTRDRYMIDKWTKKIIECEFERR